MNQIEPGEGREHYYCDYDNLMRFISYFYQIQLANEIECENVLEIGIGNKTVSDYLKKVYGYKVTTCDLNRDLEPDYTADIRHLPFEENQFDLVIACEILEHIPWRDVSQALEQLRRVTRHYVLISLPFASLCFETVLRWPLMQKFFGKRYIDLFFRVPFVSLSKRLDCHEWEIGTPGISLRKIRRILRQHFQILKERRPVLNPRHYFFLLDKT